MDIVTYSNQIVARTANGIRQTYEYDKKGQLLAVKDSDGNAVERYAYDKAGNMLRKQILRTGRAGAPRTPQSADYLTTTFTFDDANQLVSSTTDGVTTHYAYDAAGRMVREGNKTYRYGYLDKVLSVTDGDTTRTFTYHADGQLASATVGTSSSRPGRDALVASDTETFLWDGLALIQRGDEQFVNEPHVGGGNPVASSKGTSYFNDALGTTVGAKKDGKYSAAALTAFGESLETLQGEVTSNIKHQTSNSQNFFTGKPFVKGLGHAFLMRNYRAGLAKWQTADPMGYPDGWNALAYCGNGAVIGVDLYGASKIKISETVIRDVALNPWLDGLDDNGHPCKYRWRAQNYVIRWAVIEDGKNESCDVLDWIELGSVGGGLLVGAIGLVVSATPVAAAGLIIAAVGGVVYAIRQFDDEDENKVYDISELFQYDEEKHRTFREFKYE